MDVSTDVIRRIWNDKEGVVIEVRPDNDGLGMVCVVNMDKKSAEYWGAANLSMEPVAARALGAALILAASEAEKS